MHDAGAEADIRRQFGERVRQARSTRGLSQEELAHRAGLDRTYIGGVERGRRNVSIVNIKRIADALDTAVRDLF